MKLIIFAVILALAVWLGATAGHWMDRRVKAREIAMEQSTP